MEVDEHIELLRTQTQQNRLDIARHEAVCQERYEQLLKTMGDMTDNMKNMRGEIKELRTIATTGRTSLKTLLWIGSVATAAVGIFVGVASYLK